MSMKKSKINQKIIRKLICLAALVCTVGAVAKLSASYDKGVIPASLNYSAQKAPVIVIDAGHGGIDGGCSTADGVPEKGINLSILQRLRDMLEISGYQVVVTRDKDVSIHDKGVEGIANQKSSDMDNRLEIFNKYENAICISIHQNQFTDSKYNGAQMFYSGTNDASQRLADIMQGKFVEYIQPDNKRETKLCGKELFLCYFSKNPTVMAECGFLSNPEEAELLKTEEYQTKVAFTIYSAVNEFLNTK